MVQLNTAWHVLSDSVRRRQYDCILDIRKQEERRKQETQRKQEEQRKQTEFNLLKLACILIVVCSIVFINIPKQQNNVNSGNIRAKQTTTPKTLIAASSARVWQDKNLQPLGQGHFLRRTEENIIIFSGIKEKALPINDLCEYDITYVDVITRLRDAPTTTYID